MNPWDRFAACVHGDDVLVTDAGDTLIHDEIVIHAGDFNPGVVSAVMGHAHDRFLARWTSLNWVARFIAPPSIVAKGRMLSRYRKV